MFDRVRHERESGRGSSHGRTLIGLGLIAGAAIWSAGKLGWSLDSVDWPTLSWPIAAATTGVFLLFAKGGRRPAKGSDHPRGSEIHVRGKE